MDLSRSATSRLESVSWGRPAHVATAGSAGVASGEPATLMENSERELGPFPTFFRHAASSQMSGALKLSIEGVREQETLVRKHAQLPTKHDAPLSNIA
eukprot:1505896-Alexandrium_andersonii.AAC.1